MSNYSVLPWYEAIEGQDFRKWWKYGRIYPLFSRPNSIIPSFIIRKHETAEQPTVEDTVNLANMYSSYYPGNVMDGWNPVSGAGSVASFKIGDLYSSGWDYLYIRGALKSPIGYAWAVVDGDDTVIASGNGDGYINLSEYDNSDWLYIQLTLDSWPEDIEDNLAEYKHPRLDLSSGPDMASILLPYITELYTPDGKFVKDIWKPGLWVGKVIGTKDYLFPSYGLAVRVDMPEGQYYIKASDGERTWYSDVFTVFSLLNEADYLRIQWWNDSDWEMADGTIIPSASNMGNNNDVFLKAQIAKPEYRYEEEGETRDGVFYPSKQISTKVYRFAFFAPEYLLDVLRLVPMADHVVVTSCPGGILERDYEPSQILLTPTWEAEGDLAAVAVEMQTDTIAKKLGLAYIRGK